MTKMDNVFGTNLEIHFLSSLKVCSPEDNTVSMKLPSMFLRCVCVCGGGMDATQEGAEIENQCFDEVMSKLFFFLFFWEGQRNT